MAYMGGMSRAELSWAEFLVSLRQAVFRGSGASLTEPWTWFKWNIYRRAKRIISAPGTDSSILLIPALAVCCQKWKQRHCADKTSRRTRPARLPKTWQGDPSLGRGISSAFGLTRAQLLHNNSVWDQSLLLSAQHHQQRCWKAQVSRRCCLKFIKVQAQVLTRSMGKLGTTKCATKKATRWSGRPTYLELKNYYRENE